MDCKFAFCAFNVTEKRIKMTALVVSSEAYSDKGSGAVEDTTVVLGNASSIAVSHFRVLHPTKAAGSKAASAAW